MSSSLADRFLARWNGPRGLAAPEHAPAGSADCDRGDRAVLDVTLSAAMGRARAALPGVALDEPLLCDALADRAPTDRAACDALAALLPEEIALADACARGVPEALAIFESRFVHKFPAWLAHLRAPGWLVDEAAQRVRERLFVAEPGQPARIAQYAGQGPLESWVRVASVRVALNLLAAVRPEERGASRDIEAAAALLPPGESPELDYMKLRYRASFAVAFREALAALPPRDRNLLRFHYLDRLPTGRIGAIYGVHRTTVARWIDEARAAVLAGTRSRLIQKLRMSEAECDSLIDLVRSRLQVTVSSVLRASG